LSIISLKAALIVDGVYIVIHCLCLAGAMADSVDTTTEIGD